MLQSQHALSKGHQPVTVKESFLFLKRTGERLQKRRMKRKKEEEEVC